MYKIFNRPLDTLCILLAILFSTYWIDCRFWVIENHLKFTVLKLIDIKQKLYEIECKQNKDQKKIDLILSENREIYINTKTNKEEK